MDEAHASQGKKGKKFSHAFKKLRQKVYSSSARKGQEADSNRLSLAPSTNARPSEDVDKPLAFTPPNGLPPEDTKTSVEHAKIESNKSTSISAGEKEQAKEASSNVSSKAAMKQNIPPSTTTRTSTEEKEQSQEASFNASRKAAIKPNVTPSSTTRTSTGGKKQAKKRSSNASSKAAMKQNVTPSSTTHTSSDGSIKYFGNASTNSSEPSKTVPAPSLGYTTPGYEWASSSNGYDWETRRQIYGGNVLLGEHYTKTVSQGRENVERNYQQLEAIRVKPKAVRTLIASGFSAGIEV